MANANAFTLDVAGWIGPREWAAAPETSRAALLSFVAGRAVFYKKVELSQGIDAFGKKLVGVKPASRPDGATGPALDPHFGESRTVKWMRSSVSNKYGRISIWWSHGFGRILGYHADGLVRGAPVRDVIGLAPADERKLMADALAHWRALARRETAVRRRNARPRDDAGRFLQPGSPSRPGRPASPGPIAARGR